MLEHIYICRHGFRANWVDPSIKSGPTGMNRDPPLAVYGEEQVTTLATFLSDPKSTNPYPTPELVFSSPFYRCIQSALPTAKSLGKRVMLEHGVQEWYSHVIPGTGLHPRPSSSSKLSQFFPPNSLVGEAQYPSTYYPSRKGESLKELHERAEIFIDAWISRIESEYPDVKAVVVFGHAASIIVLGRALTGDKTLDVSAGCASTSLYKRKSTSTSTSSTETETGTDEGGVGQWEIIWNGNTKYLPNGTERNWSFRDIILKNDGSDEVIDDKGDSILHEHLDEWPEGLGEGMEKWLRNTRKEQGAKM